MHAIEIYLECGHMNTERLEAAIFIPPIGAERVCTICRQQTKIKRTGSPYWIDEEDLKRIKEQSAKR